MEKKRIIGVIGPSQSACTPQAYQIGLRIGKLLVDKNYTIVCGGLTGMMEAVCKGAHQSKNYAPGSTIGILPGCDKLEANLFVDVVIPSGMGTARNTLIVRTADVLVAVGGGAGTLSEIAFAWQFNKHVVCYQGLGGWSERLAGNNLDHRKENLLHPATSLECVARLVDSLLLPPSKIAV